MSTQSGSERFFVLNTFGKTTIPSNSRLVVGKPEEFNAPKSISAVTPLPGAQALFCTLVTDSKRPISRVVSRPSLPPV
jgi:hypothetical protein